jgi:murein DD-endopeptidase MepM/ murein hydrolase activator NlpD
MRSRTTLALGLAGLATAGLGGAVLPAGAEMRTFELTFLDGKVVTLSVDVPPDADPWDIAYPGVDTAMVTSIAEVPTPAAVTPAPATATGTTPPAAGTTTATGPASPAADTPADPAQPDEPRPAGEPQAREGGGKQQTTGPKKRGARNADDDASARAETQADEDDRDRERSARPGEGGLPTLDNPTTSLAIPGAAPIGVPNFFIDKFRIPPFLLSIYQAAGMEYGIRWEVLAAINEIETDYGRNLNVSSAGALGWMQFMPATWKQYGTDANGDKRKDPYNPVDAIFSAARYLKAAGAEQDLRKAVFAYNHADWYVDSVLMRARLIGGLPSNLVGSLTGLTQGMFPVAAKARYADDLSEREATRRVNLSRHSPRNAALPVESSAGRRGINVFADAGSPVVAVQDGKIVKIGSSERLGKFIQLRDVFGNTYTYAGLKSVADRHPVPKRETVTKEQVRQELKLPKRDPRPKQPASAGTQRKGATSPSAKPRAALAPAKAPAVEKQRLFAAPKRPAAYKAGGEEQLLESGTLAGGTFSRYFVGDFGLDEKDVRLRKLKVGSKVVGGTILGRIGRTTTATAPHMLFEIRPAGRGAPRIDPKPILDGWKLLESTAIYRAESKNPFHGDDAKAPTIGQILLMSKDTLQRRVLANPRISIYDLGRRQIRSGAVDRRVLATLEFLAANGLKPTVSSLFRDGSITTSGNLSHHATGTAVDIAAINGISVMGHQGSGSITDISIRRLLSLQGAMRPDQIISLMKYPSADNTLAMGDHADHIHVGFRPVSADTRQGSVLNATLKPGQWFKVIDRLNEIENPVVRRTPSKASIKVKSVRPTARAQARARRGR